VLRYKMKKYQIRSHPPSPPLKKGGDGKHSVTSGE
jgi:hypothetical protein